MIHQFPSSRVSQEVMHYRDFSVHFSSAGDDLLVSVLASPGGETKARVPVRLEGQEVTCFVAGLGSLAGGFRTLTTRPAGEGWATPTLEQFGTRLYDALFPDPIRSLFDASAGFLAGERQHGPDGDVGLRVKVVVAPGDPKLSWIAQVPWEGLFRPEKGARGRFLALDRSTSIVRYIQVPESPLTRPFRPPLRILVVASQPEEAPPLNLTHERSELAAAWNAPGSKADVEIEVLDHPTRNRVLRALETDRPFDVLHFMGHAEFDPGTAWGTLLLETESRKVDPISGFALADLLRGASMPRLVVLNACETARSAAAGEGVFAGIASALVEAGLPAAIAMQFPISDRAALAFCGAAYRRLGLDGSIDSAVALGRHAVRFELESIEWVVPVLFMRVSDGQLFAPDQRAGTEQATNELELQIDADLVECSEGAVQDIVTERGVGDAAGRRLLQVRAGQIRASGKGSVQRLATRVTNTCDPDQGE